MPEPVYDEISGSPIADPPAVPPTAGLPAEAKPAPLAPTSDDPAWPPPLPLPSPPAAPPANPPGPGVAPLALALIAPMSIFDTARRIAGDFPAPVVNAIPPGTSTRA